jgi:PAS domain S-box-containing protein
LSEIREMKYFESEVMISESRLFDTLPGAAAIVDREGEVITSNKKWASKDFTFHWFGELPKPVNGNYFEHCEKAVVSGNDHALKVIFGLRNIFDREKDFFELTVPCSKKEGKGWFKITITPYDKSGESVLILFEDVSKNMRSLQSLRESEEIYSQHFRHSLSGIILGSPDGHIFDVNPSACKILGYTREELLKGGRPLIADDKNEINKKANEIREKKSFFEGEKIYTHKNGTDLTVEVSSVLYKNENGSLRVINTFRDKSREKETLQTLKDERRFTEAVINSTPNIFFVIDEKLNLVRWNESFENELGYDKTFVSQSRALDFFSEADRDRVKQVAKEALISGTGHVIAEVLSKKKGIRHFHLQTKSFESNGESFLVGTGTDITDMIEIEKEKDKNYELISQLFESSPLGMVMVSRENNIMKVNDSFTSLFGYSKLESIGEKIEDLIVPEDQVLCFKDFISGVFEGEVAKREVIRRNKLGEELIILVNAVPIWQNDEVVAAYGIYVDLTEQKAMEVRIQKSLEEKEVLLKEVHHRVKNNLAIIAGLIDLQIMEEDDKLIEKKLNEVRSRIFSIAKIHETLYEKEDVVNIRFDQYLKTIMEALPQLEFSEDQIKISMETDDVSLNLNQAVPCGLAVNELMNIIFASSEILTELNFKLSEKNGEIILIVKGSQLNLDHILPFDDSKTFKNRLLEIFLTQINGTVSVSDGNEKEISLTFKKMNLRGSSSSIMSSHEIAQN